MAMAVITVTTVTMLRLCFVTSQKEQGCGGNADRNEKSSHGITP
jgi:hypothetical protein